MAKSAGAKKRPILMLLSEMGQRAKIRTGKTMASQSEVPELQQQVEDVSMKRLQDTETNDEGCPVGPEQERRRWRRRRKLLLLATGLALLLSAALLGAPASNATSRATLLFMRSLTALTPGSFAAKAWSSPPFNPRLSVFVFNVTNAEGLSSGAEGKPRLAEVGPFVYEAEQRREVSRWSEGGEELAFRSRTTYRFLPEESAFASDEGEEATLTVPNVLAITGMLKDEVRGQPGKRGEIKKT